MENQKPTIHELLVELEHVRGQIEGLKMQHAIFISRFESERDTLKDRHTGIDSEIERVSKMIIIEIDKVEKEWQNIIFNRETGIAFVIDRLLEKDKKRDVMKNQLIGLSIAVGLLIAEKIFDFITSKK